jgi:hypothetical protein
MLTKIDKYFLLVIGLFVIIGIYFFFNENSYTIYCINSALFTLLIWYVYDKILKYKK